MSYNSAFHEPDPDDWGDDDDEPRTVRCKYCGKAGLHWDDDGDGNWMLMETKHRVHKCDSKRVDQRTADDFEDLDA